MVKDTELVHVIEKKAGWPNKRQIIVLNFIQTLVFYGCHRILNCMHQPDNIVQALFFTAVVTCTKQNGPILICFPVLDFNK